MHPGVRVCESGGHDIGLWGGIASVIFELLGDIFCSGLATIIFVHLGVRFCEWHDVGLWTEVFIVTCLATQGRSIEGTGSSLRETRSSSSLSADKW